MSITTKNDKVMSVKSWKSIKDDVFGKEGTARRDELERESVKWTCNHFADR